MLTRRQLVYLGYAGLGAVALRSVLAHAKTPVQQTAAAEVLA